MSGRAILATTKTPDGVPVVLYADTWSKDVLGPRTGPRELRTELDAVLATVAAPDHREADPREGRERFYKRNVGPSRWLMVVVSFEEEPARIVTALGYGHGRSPSGWMP